MRARDLLVAAALAATVLAAAGPVEGEPGEVTEDGFTILGVDPSGDWPEAAEVGATLGQDLTGVSVRLAPEADEPTLEVKLDLASLPPTGGVPEVTRYTINLLVDGGFVELDGKFTNYSRGTCDPTAATCPPPRDPGMQPFAVRGNCVTQATGNQNVTTCEEIGLVTATFDAAAATILVPLPLALLEGAGHCSLVEAGPNTFAGSVSAAPAAFLTHSQMPMDTMFIDATFQVPSADGAACPPPAA